MNSLLKTTPTVAMLVFFDTGRRVEGTTSVVQYYTSVCITHLQCTERISEENDADSFSFAIREQKQRRERKMVVIL